MARRLRQLQGLSVSRIEGIGPRRLKGLEEMGITTILDLISHYPRRYVDRSNQVPIRELEIGAEALVIAKVRRVESRQTRQRRSLIEVDVSDASGVLRCVFFNQPWRAKQLVDGTEVGLFGRVDAFRGLRQMTSPVVDLLGDATGRIVPLYPQSDKAGLSTWELGRWIAEALERSGEFAEPLPARWRRELGLVGRDEAMKQIHSPESMGAAQTARRRLAFDELLRLQLVLVMRKRAVERDAVGIRHQLDPAGGSLVERFHAALPFPLTGAQRRAIDAIGADLASPRPMHRLLQGDVGSGKTVVAALAAAVCIDAGWQCALMAPTELLAEQHLRKLVGWLEPLGVRVAWITGSVKGKKREGLLLEAASGEAQLVVGTHAVIEDKVQFDRLGLAIVDEQHRFGVAQRLALRRKLAERGL